MAFLESLVEAFQYRIRRSLWGMDIDRTARIAPSAYVDRTWPKGVHIGAGCIVGGEAVVLTHDMVRGLYLDTYIGARTILGPRCVVMPGVTVGEDCRVEAGAVVIRDMPPRCRAAGNPAVISELDGV